MKMKKWAALAALLLAVGAATGATAEVAVNDHVFFGHYEQDNDLTNGAEAIEWRVLKVENGEALLISQYALDSQPYNEKYAVALWSKCTLRTWLNTAFYDAAFNDTEKQSIVTKKLENWKDVNTQDTVSLLDNDEAKTLFENHADRMTVPTAYAIAQGAWQSQKYGPGNAQWWLRSHSWEEKHRGAYVAGSGGVMTCGGNSMGRVDNTRLSVRPAIYVATDALEALATK